MQGTRKQNVSYKWVTLCSGKYFGKTYFVIHRKTIIIKCGILQSIH